MNDGSTEALVIGRASSRRRYTYSVTTEHFELLVVNINLCNDRTIDSLESELVNTNI
ncbi:hypothetical protein D3C85_1607870 [compost metagenome]